MLKRRNQVMMLLLLAVFLLFSLFIPILVWAKPLPKSQSERSHKKTYISDESQNNFKNIPEKFRNRKFDHEVSVLLDNYYNKKANNVSGKTTEDTVDVVIKSNNVDLTKVVVKKHGGKFVRNFGSTIFAKLPISSIPNIADEPSVLYIRLSKKVRPCVQDALGPNGLGLCPDGSLQNLESLSPYDGKGVLIVIPGIGIDPTLFNDETGKTRVLNYVDANASGEINVKLDGSDMSIYGKEYTSEDINSGNVSLARKGEHDTLTAGLAAGSNTGTTRGVAPKANLILYECQGDPEEGWMVESSNMDAILYGSAKAAEYNMPWVMSLSLGSEDLRCDGKDDFSRALSSLIQTDPNLKAVCVAAGNEACPAWIFKSDQGEIKFGSSDWTIYTGDSDSTVDWELHCTVPHSPDMEIEICEYEDSSYTAIKNVLIRNYKLDFNHESRNLTSEDGAYKISMSKDEYAPDNYFSYMDECAYEFVNIQASSLDQNKKYFKAYFKNIGDGESLVKACCGTAAGLVPAATRVDSENMGGNISSPGCCPDVITVGAYSKEGNLADFSCTGPLLYMNRNFRYPKPEIVAVGTDMYNLLFPSWGQVYDGKSGTSLSTPLVAGLAALLVQKNPNASAEEIKRVLIESATSDEFTGVTPNNQYGYGKASVRALGVDIANEPTQSPTEESTEQPSGEPQAIIRPIDSHHDGGMCIIATIAYGSYMEKHVIVLRQFRDQYLKTNAPGRAFVMFYYKNSPPVAKFLVKHEWARLLTRLALTPIVYAIAYPAWAALVMLLSLSGCGLIVFCKMPRKVV